MLAKITKTSIAKNLRGKTLQGSVGDPFKKEFGSKNESELKYKIASALGGKTESERQNFYKKINLKKVGRETIEETISPSQKEIKIEPTLMEKRAIRNQLRMKQKRNIYESTRSAMSQAGSGVRREESIGSFAGGKVVTKTMIGGRAIGADSGTGTMSDLSGKSTFAKTKNDISNNKIQPNSGLGGSSSRPLGF